MEQHDAEPTHTAKYTPNENENLIVIILFPSIVTETSSVKLLLCFKSFWKNSDIEKYSQTLFSLMGEGI